MPVPLKSPPPLFKKRNSPRTLLCRNFFTGRYINLWKFILVVIVPSSKLY